MDNWEKILLALAAAAAAAAKLIEILEDKPSPYIRKL
jgi:hypothetical protein